MARVVQLNLHEDEQGRAPEELMRAWPTLGQLARAATGAGARVQVMQASRTAARWHADGVDYCFGPAQQLPLALSDWRPDIVHVQGLAQGLAAVQLLGGMWRPRAAHRLRVLLQDRADRVPRPWRWLAWRRTFARVHGLIFCHAEQAAPWQRRGLIPSGQKLYELPGSSSDFRPRERDEARRLSGIRGEPALLWVGHLDSNKDPLTVLAGLARATPHFPDLQLWCCYGRNTLEDEMRSRVAADTRLQGRVHWLGPQAHERIELLMSAADVLVQGSHREATGYTVLEALACGLPPLVTDIPSFRALLGEAPGAGRLWRAGHAEGLSQALLALMRQPAVERRQAARQRFEMALSPAAWGGRMVRIYEEALSS